MQNIEKAIVPELNSEAVAAFIINHLSSTNLLRDATPAVSAPDNAFNSNDAFWKSILARNATALSWIELPSFQISDWYPRSPGLYHTDEAHQQRKRALQNLVDEDGVSHYRPAGKTDMIAGGIGTIRFKPISIEGSAHWMCTATSDHYCHTGIPLAVPQRLLSNIDIYKPGKFRVVGQLRFLPKFFDEYFQHYIRIPQLYVQVSELRRLSDDGHPITVTPMVFFEAEGEWGEQHNVTYVQCSSLDDEELDRASDWIEGYVQRYGLAILTNFDQQRPTFANVPFSLQTVMTNRLDAAAINSLHIYRAELIQPEINKIFAEKADMSTNISITLGDGTVIHGDMVVANSIRDSFNRVATADSPDDIKETLKELVPAMVKLVEGLDKESAAETARDLEALTAEATSTSPRKKWWQLSIDGITTAAEKVADVGKPVLEILAKLTPLLLAAS